MVDEILSIVALNGWETHDCFSLISNHSERFNWVLNWVCRDQNGLVDVAAHFSLGTNVIMLVDEFSFEKLLSIVFDRLFLEQMSSLCNPLVHINAMLYS